MAIYKNGVEQTRVDVASVTSDVGDVQTEVDALNGSAMYSSTMVGTDNAALATLSGLVANTTIDLNQGSGAKDLFTGTAQAVILESLIIKMPSVQASGSVTSIAIATDDATPAVFINSTDGDVTNLSSEAEIYWTGMAYITVDTKIQLTIGGGAHGTTYTCKVTAKYRSVVAGGTLA